jgi:hypothetical protein
MAGRILKPTGSFHYHCDWHASPFKVMLDQLFGENAFQNEIVWMRQSSHSDMPTPSIAHKRLDASVPRPTCKPLSPRIPASGSSSTARVAASDHARAGWSVRES